MSPRNRRAAAAALAGALAVGGPIATADAASPRAIAADSGSGNPPENATDPAPAVAPTDPAPGPVAPGTSGSTLPAQPIPPVPPVPANAQCGQVILTATLPTVVTCGPITVTFNTVTTTTTITTVAAPITVANGSITNATSTQSAVTAPVSSRSCTVNATTTPPKRRTTVKRRKPTAKRRSLAKRKPVKLVATLPKGARAVRFCLYFAPRPGA
jgi:hypothetical protein